MDLIRHNEPGESAGTLSGPCPLPDSAMYHISRLRRVLSGGMPVVARLFYGKRFAVTGPFV